MQEMFAHHFARRLDGSGKFRLASRPRQSLLTSSIPMVMWPSNSPMVVSGLTKPCGW